MSEIQQKPASLRELLFEKPVQGGAAIFLHSRHFASNYSRSTRNGVYAGDTIYEAILTRAPLTDDQAAELRKSVKRQLRHNDGPLEPKFWQWFEELLRTHVVVAKKLDRRTSAQVTFRDTAKPTHQRPPIVSTRPGQLLQNRRER